MTTDVASSRSHAHAASHRGRDRFRAEACAEVTCHAGNRVVEVIAPALFMLFFGAGAVVSIRGRFPSMLVSASFLILP